MLSHKDSCIDTAPILDLIIISPVTYIPDLFDLNNNYLTILTCPYHAVWSNNYLTYHICITPVWCYLCGAITILPAGHVIITVYWNVGNKAVVKTVVAVWCPKPLIKAMFQWQVMWQMTEMPAIASISVMSINGGGKKIQNILIAKNIIAVIFFLILKHQTPKSWTQHFTARYSHTEILSKQISL